MLCFVGGLVPRVGGGLLVGFGLAMAMTREAGADRVWSSSSGRMGGFPPSC